MDQSELQQAVQRLFRTAKPTQVFRTDQVQGLLANMTEAPLTPNEVRQALYALPDFAHPRPARSGDGLAWTFGATAPPPAAAERKPRRQLPRKSIAESQRLTQ